MMAKKRRMINPFQVLSPGVDAEVLRLKELHRAVVSESSALHEGIVIMMSKLVEMAGLLSECAITGDTSRMDECLAVGRNLRQEEQVLTRFLVSSGLSADMWKGIARFPYRLKRIGDMLDSIRRCFHIRAEGGIPLSDQAVRELKGLFELLLGIMGPLKECLLTPTEELLEETKGKASRLLQTIDDARQAHWERLERGICVPEASSLYRDILDSLKTADEYLEKMCLSLLDTGEGATD